MTINIGLVLTEAVHKKWPDLNIFHIFGYLGRHYIPGWDNYVRENPLPLHQDERRS
jgi:hypothetical protein